MSRELLINQTIGFLEKLPEERVKEVLQFAEFLHVKYEEQIVQKGIELLADKSESFQYLKKEEDLYTVNDLKEKYK